MLVVKKKNGGDMKKIIFLLAFLAFTTCEAVAESAEEMMATFLNLKGQLCAKVLTVSKLSLPDTYEVRCIEYRGGSGTVDYIVNVKSGEVFKR